MTEITLEDIPAITVLGTRKTGTYALIPELLMKVYEYAQEQHATITGPPLFICHETSPEAVLRAQENGTAVVEVAWPAAGKVQGTQDIREYELPGGKMACTIHKGPYESCEPTYIRLFAWIEENGFTICGPVREEYPNDPREVATEDIITRIYVPLK
jgi:effector-binding domain-containing protein